MKVACDVDTMETEQIVGIYRILEKEKTIESVALWSCFFDYKGKTMNLTYLPLDVTRLLNSDLVEDSMLLKEAVVNFSEDNRKTDKFCNSPVRSKYLSQNYLDNYLFVEGSCKNLAIS